MGPCKVVGAVQVLRELVQVAPSCCTADTVGVLVPSLQNAIGVRAKSGLWHLSCSSNCSSCTVLLDMSCSCCCSRDAKAQKAAQCWRWHWCMQHLAQLLNISAAWQEARSGGAGSPDCMLREPAGPQDKQASREFLKIAAMTFLRLALTTAAPAAWQPHLAKLGPLVVGHAGERYYKAGPWLM